MSQLIFAVSIFLICYVLIFTEKAPAAVVSILGATLLITSGVLTAEEAVGFIDMEVIFLLIGMMIIVNSLADTGLFEWIAIKIAQSVRAYPFPLMLLLSLITACLSAFLDNVTTILVIAPVTILLAKQLDIDPVPFVISQTIASNIGGAATLIGDPPLLLIAAYSDFTFNDFLFHLMPIAIINLVVFSILCWIFFGRKIEVSRYKRANIMNMDAQKAIHKGRSLKRSLVIFFLVILGFFTYRITQLSPAIIAMMGAASILLLSGKSSEHAFSQVEWNTLFFFAGLFILVGGINKVGLLKLAGEYILGLTQGNLKLTAMSILWMSSCISAVLDNIPYTATIAPMLKDTIIPNIIKMYPYISSLKISHALWWSLALGACLGGNGTLLGASANIVAADIARKSGYKITFLRFSKYGVFFMLATTLTSSFYVYLRYLNY